MDATSDFDAYLDQVLVGGREQTEIVICDYDASWPTLFEVQRQRLSSVLGNDAVAIEHIGSTAVPGLAAKPIIDVLVTVEAVEPDDPFRTKLEDAGYALRVHEPEHRMFRTRAGDVHVHVWPNRHDVVERYLVFRDWLRHYRAALIPDWSGAAAAKDFGTAPGRCRTRWCSPSASAHQ